MDMDSRVSDISVLPAKLNAESVSD